MMKKELHKFIKNALKEDIGDGDHSSLATIQRNIKSKAQLLIKDKGIIAGIKLAEMIFKTVDNNLKIITNVDDGDKVSNGDIAFIVEGSCISILTAERLVLNCMQHMSGIATKTFHLNCLKVPLSDPLDHLRKTIGNLYR